MSGVVKITPAKVPDTETTVEALLEWRAAFGTPEVVVSDMASYFMSDVMKELAMRCNFKQHWTVAYGHYNNGTIEVINKIYLMLMRALISELKWKKHDWPWLNSNIEHTINHRPQSRLNDNAPITVMTGMRADNPLDQIFRRKGVSFSEDSGVMTKFQKHVDELLEALKNMHKQVNEKTLAERNSKKLKKNEKRKPPNFSLADFVLIGLPEPEKQAGRKLYLKWRGPFKITNMMNNYVFEVENIVNQERKIIHGDRVRLYAEKCLNITEEIKRQFAYDNASYEISEFKGCKFNPNTKSIEVLVSWKGFADIDDSWEPLQTMIMDVPGMVKGYGKKLKAEKHELAEAVQQLCTPIE